MTLLTVSIMAEEVEELGRQVRAAAAAGAEALEVRLDGVKTLTAATAAEFTAVAKKTKLPVIATCREKDEGGLRAFVAAEKTAILTACVEAGAEFIDCEQKLFARKEISEPLKQSLKSHPSCRLILSAHQFKGPFADLNIKYETMLSLWPMAICKLVYQTRHITDCFEGLDLLHRAGNDMIVFCMGPVGQMTRILSKKLGAFLTFAASDAGGATAPGQLPVSVMKQRYGWERLNKDTEVFGLVGDPVAHSISPLVFNTTFAKNDINAIYLPFWVEGEREEFNAFIEGMICRPWLNAGGFSITLPHKTHALDFVSRKGEFIDPLAAGIGAANTLKVGFNGIVSGYNTDYAGAMDALTAAMNIDRHGLHQKEVAVLGAGGAARAVVAGLTNVGAVVTIYNRTAHKAESLASEFHCSAAGLDELTHHHPSVVINCTSLGMHPDVESCPVSADVLRPEMTVFDTVYTPMRTRLLHEAEKVGAKTVSGVEMFVRQAMAQYRIFVGEEPDGKSMRQAALDALAARQG